ncbi:MAG TPA: EamA family transporter RarD [Sphingorhabdus sp.]|jgi:chloramphenicol-sensitive protein RarD|nr:EamA family transporter RarD [Sphingorhabdus sp.]
MTQAEERLDRVGLATAFGAYFIWGFLPVFFKQVQGVLALEIIAHRVAWAVPFLLLIMAFRRQLGEYWAALTAWTTLRWMLVSAALISVNWLIYVWAVNGGHILAASLGYFLNPLLNILLGTVFLKERLNRTQWIAVGIASIGVAILATGAFDTLWISVSLALSFGFYGLVRKLAPTGAVPGLGVETTLLLPLAIAGMWWFAKDASAGFGSDGYTDLILIAGGAVTAIPLLLFATAARRMPYSVLGFIQYIGPTIQFLLGYFVYHEELSGPRLLCFGLIWLALAIFSCDALRRMRSNSLA